MGDNTRPREHTSTPSEMNQYTIVSSPDGLPPRWNKPKQEPPSRGLRPDRFPASSKSCQASDPPFCQPVPSARQQHCPSEIPPHGGMLSLVLAPGAAMDDKSLSGFGSISSK